MITSAGNAKIKFVRSLIKNKKEREGNQAFVVEGVRLAEECLRAACIPQMVFHSSQLSDRGTIALNQLRGKTDEIFEVTPELLNRVSDTRTSQGIILVLGYPDIQMMRKIDFALVLDGINDPGNLGTILRTACASGVQAVILTKGSVDHFNPKVVRAGMGAHFKLPICIMTEKEILSFCKNTCVPPLEIMVSDVTRGTPSWESNLSRPLCLVIGSEASGVSQEIAQHADFFIHIPMKDDVESYNASIAASILMYETLRQRKKE